jgi:4-amino-4-deoxy-L-arabinose transferase-like glycosyltransferase
MKHPEYSNEPDKRDYLVALILVILFLAAYVRTLAPDILYSDSAEFQCLAYTLGITHSTGYPIYLVLGRLLGFLPINNPAWRISLLSAVCAAITIGGTYLLARYFTRSRVGAALGSVALGISYTFWSQAVIAEVYTPALAFLVAIMLLLFHWQTEPGKRNLFLLAAALLAGIGFGVHASVWLVAPPAVALVLWTLWRRPASRSEWIRSFSFGLLGALAGLAIYLAAFFISDRVNSPTSFINTTLEPSRIFWKLQPEDFNSPFKRLEMTVVSAQWGDALFPSRDFSFINELGDFGAQLTKLEFPPLVLLFALIGLAVMLITCPTRGTFYPLAFLFSAFLILNYQVWDKFVFYLSLYIPLAVAVGTGMGFALDWVHRYMESVPGRSYRLLYLLVVLFFVTMVVQPTAAVRWKALQNGAADFVTEDYPYPVENLEEPRLVAQMRLAGTADNAVYVLDWRALYTTAYLAHVERGMTNTLFFEAMPRGNDGKVASTLIAELKSYLQEGRPVYTDQRYPGLEVNFRLVPASGDLYRLSLRQ